MSIKEMKKILIDAKVLKKDIENKDKKGEK
jgi:hypothetical protein